MSRLPNALIGSLLYLVLDIRAAQGLKHTSLGSLGSALPDALLITRLHHVPHWRELVGSLGPRVGSSPASPELVGYRAFLICR
jgi:hypothetical protein